ncbi:HAMP domain-containing histidine kinase [Pseudenhygromyxa sp. WMMC2535]|uniref:HAMP domain-containing sensor histidine kinase n=1 Tax=Pseudenhygromyxa sp. WMMC2535 TaxID=2712867 RepID=UPI00155426A4|nr:HAMP domain-containing sensor histidine kinase [Pseudenhygromyxa sp. WMMC2535]NVB40770.1 HAMP domain-containing histidine kinase [Pseudenhygromyxa sp. WMMC2535]
MATTEPSTGSARGRLFVRIYATFMVSVLLFGLLAAGLASLSASSRDNQRAEAVFDRVTAEAERMVPAMRLQDEDSLRTILAEMDEDFDALVILHPFERNANRERQGEGETEDEAEAEDEGPGAGGGEDPSEDRRTPDVRDLDRVRAQQGRDPDLDPGDSDDFPFPEGDRPPPPPDDPFAPPPDDPFAPPPRDDQRPPPGDSFTRPSTQPRLGDQPGPTGTRYAPPNADSQTDDRRAQQERGEARARWRRMMAPPVSSDPKVNPQEVPPPTPREYRRLLHGRPVLRTGPGPTPPTIIIPLFEPEADTESGRRPKLLGAVSITPHHDVSGWLFAAGLLLLLALAGGAYPLARSLTSRLDTLERSTRALARGELSHRAKIEGDPRDEIDSLALSFNQMAERLETLVSGQRTLLTNVSHELRTPIARIKVLIEILGERIEQLEGTQARGEPIDTETLARLSRGLDEMQEDLGEVEGLIRDLLTSGRLELVEGGALQLEPIELCELCEQVAGRFDATVECQGVAEDHSFEGDRMLLERLLKNLLANARRACPAGALTIRGGLEGEGAQRHMVIEVEDEGPGVPEDKRSLIFEPFARLDAARARDKGGVGLGLYLCRQIARAHGGTLSAESRRDGRPGARFVLRL